MKMRIGRMMLPVLMAGIMTSAAYGGTFDVYNDYPNPDGTYSYYFDQGLKVTLDEDWYQNTMVIADDDGATFYHKASYEAYKEEGYEGGRLFTLGASVNTDFKELPSFEYIGFDEEEAMNYFAVLPTDVQAYMKDETIAQEYEKLYAGVKDVIGGISIVHAGDDVHEESQAETELVQENAQDDVILSDDSSDFVLLSEAVPDAILEIRYYSTYNFVGERIDGYEEPLAFLTNEAAQALREVSDELVEKGYRLKIFDAYRPQMAVTNFVEWAEDTDDTRMKEFFYPNLEKDVLFPQGYIAEHSGHSRGSTVDLTLFDMETEKELDMGGTFDFFGELSHPDYKEITEEQFNNRMILRDAMLEHGFRPLETEWWHFTLDDEPYPDTYFTFPVSSESVSE